MKDIEVSEETYSELQRLSRELNLPIPEALSFLMGGFNEEECGD